jgi:hypothetical protein
VVDKDQDQRHAPEEIEAQIAWRGRFRQIPPSSQSNMAHPLTGLTQRRAWVRQL